MDLPELDELEQIVPFEELLTDSEKQRLVLAQSKIPIMERNIEKAERAGIDMSEQKKSLADMKLNVSKLLRELDTS